MDNQEKVVKAISNIRPDTEYTFNDEITTEEHFNTIRWKTGVDGNTSISTTVNPHPELTWSAVSAEMDRLQAEYDALAYSRKRESEYPSTKDFMEAYTEKEIGGSSGKWDAYVINYNKVRSDNPK
jgi:hypothetical protein